MRKQRKKGSQFLVYVFFLFSCLSFARVVCEAQFQTNTITFNALSLEMQRLLAANQITDQNFDSYLTLLRQQTEARERNGEFEHLIYFALQSGRFTALPKIEPALSAYEFVQSLEPRQQNRYLDEDEYFPPSLRLPSQVTARLTALLDSLKKKPQDDRQHYFKQFLAQHLKQPNLAIALLSNEYARVMKFLYRKEFLSRAMQEPQKLAAYVARLYQSRGHSTDTQIEANCVIYNALAAIKSQHPATKLQNVLIVGPGLDFAPRTDLMDLFGPQSYQPFAVADALLSLQLCEPQKLRIHCVDINERVVNFLHSMSLQKTASLTLLSGIAEKSDRPLSDDYKNYFQNFGHSIGTESQLLLPENWRLHLRKKIQLKPEILKAISADKMNIITQRYAPDTQFDLVIITNVFPYFTDVELSLALSNLAAMTKPGGYWLHNESRKLLNNLALLLDVPPLQSRTVLIAGNQHNALFDGVAIHRKKLS